MNLARFGLFIDPAPAQAGAKATIAAAKSIKPALEEVARTADTAGKSTAAMGTAGKDAGTKVASGMKQAASETRKAGDAARAAGGGFDSMVGKIMNMVKALAAAYAAFKLLQGGVGFLMEAIGNASQMEGFRTRWAYLLGSFDAAKKKMEELAQFANTTPFDLPGVTAASLALAKLKGTGLETMEGLRKIGDAAALAQQPIEEVAQRIARLTNNLKRGAGGGDEARMLGEWQIFSPELVGRIADMGQKASNFKELLAAIKKELGNAGGAMTLMSTTWDGLMSTMKDAWGAFKTAIGEPILQALKPMIGDLTGVIDKMKAAVVAMQPEIQRVVSYIPAAFRVLGTDGGLKLSLQAAWDYFSDLMKRTWNATGPVLNGIMKRAAWELITAIDRLNQAGFFDGMMKNLKDGITGILTDLASGPVGLGNWLGEKYMQMRTGIGPEEAKKQQEKFNEMKKTALPGQRPLKMNDGSITMIDNDLPTAESRANDAYTPNDLIGDPPPIPDFNLDPPTETEATKKYSGLFSSVFDKMLDDAKKIQEANQKLLDDKAAKAKDGGDGITGGGLFPGGAREDDGSDAKKALLPGTDIAFENADEEAKNIIKDNRTPEEANAAEIEKITALKDARLLSETEYQTAVKKTQEAHAEAQKRMQEQAAKTIEDQKTGVQKLLTSWGNLKVQIDQASVGILQSIEGNITGAITSMVDGTKSAGQAFADMAKGIVQSIIQIITKLLVQYALYSAMGMLTGGVSTAATGIIGAAVKHDGGDVSGGPTRNVAASVFAGARRYHTGGTIGGNEVPIIAEKGETVLTKDDAAGIKARLGGDGASAAPAAPPQISIANYFDPSEMAGYMSANPQVIMNIISKNAPTIRRILG